MFLLLIVNNLKEAQMRQVKGDGLQTVRDKVVYTNDRKSNLVFVHP